MTVLLVEDDKVIASGLVYVLQSKGYKVTHCATATQAMESAASFKYNLALLDVMLPDGSGFDVCEKFRVRSPNAGVIFLTASDEEDKLVRGFELGADDYITKPFAVRELLVRISAVLRRTGAGKQTETEILYLNEVQINLSEAKVSKNGQEIQLTALEYRLLLFFAQNKGLMLSRGQLLENLWDLDGKFVNDNTLTVYIKRLRQKLDDENIIRTVRGMGYTAGDEL